MSNAMMICSMTAFVRHEIKDTWGKAAWEIRSINQRYLEIDSHLPEELHSLEPIIHDLIHQNITRGKITCCLYLDIDPIFNRILIFNKKLAMQLVKAAQWIKMKSKEGNVDLLSILSWPGVMSAEKQDMDLFSAKLLTELEYTINTFVSTRETAGNALKTMIEKRLTSISVEVVKIRKQMPKILAWQRKRLLKIINDTQVIFDINRLEQELLMIAQKKDVTEELDRLEAHVQEIYQILTKNEPIGRRLDFMMQELNRESNTLGSKSIHSDITLSTIELKVLIEQMREQIQNIE